MRGTRIMVVQSKQLIKLGLCILAGIALVIALAIYFAPRPIAPTAGFAPGSYAAQIILHSRPVDVVVTVDERQITNIELVNMREEQEVFYPLFRPTLDELSAQIIKYQTTRIATTPENAVTSRILLNAVDAALSMAALEPGD